MASLRKSLLTGWLALVMRSVFVVLAQEVFAPVAAEVAPRDVDVVGVVLRVVVLDEERRPL